MLVFISWSGQRSKAVATCLQNWLSDVIQSAEPWMSTDIDKGARWANELSDRLEQSKVGIICITARSLNSPWIYFEAGALAKTKDVLVCSVLVDVPAAALEFPLAQFQHTTTTQDDILDLVRSINAAVSRSGQSALKDEVLLRVFNRNWPSLKNDLDSISKTTYDDEVSEPTPLAPLDLMTELIGATLFKAPATGLTIAEVVRAAFKQLNPQAPTPPATMLALLANEMQTKNLGILMERKYAKAEGDRYMLTDFGRDYFSQSAKRINELQDRIKAVTGE